MRKSSANIAPSTDELRALLQKLPPPVPISEVGSDDDFKQPSQQFSSQLGGSVGLSGEGTSAAAGATSVSGSGSGKSEQQKKWKAVPVATRKALYEYMKERIGEGSLRGPQAQKTLLETLGLFPPGTIEISDLKHIYGQQRSKDQAAAKVAAEAAGTSGVATAVAAGGAPIPAGSAPAQGPVGGGGAVVGGGEVAVVARPQEMQHAPSGGPPPPSVAAAPTHMPVATAAVPAGQPMSIAAMAAAAGVAAAAAAAQAPAQTPEAVQMPAAMAAPAAVEAPASAPPPEPPVPATGALAMTPPPAAVPAGAAAGTTSPPGAPRPGPTDEEFLAAGLAHGGDEATLRSVLSLANTGGMYLKVVLRLLCMAGPQGMSVSDISSKAVELGMETWQPGETKVRNGLSKHTQHSSVAALPSYKYALKCFPGVVDIRPNRGDAKTTKRSSKGKANVQQDGQGDNEDEDVVILS